jgi:hypothetical protein
MIYHLVLFCSSQRDEQKTSDDGRPVSSSWEILRSQACDAASASMRAKRALLSVELTRPTPPPHLEDPVHGKLSEEACFNIAERLS